MKLVICNWLQITLCCNFKYNHLSQFSTC